MKATKQPRWPEKFPGWEQTEVRDHYDPSDETLASAFLSSPLSLAEARDRRLNGEPLEYLLGHCHVGDITLKCDSRALIPRQETETLLRRFTRELDQLPKGSLVDCGTGTGLIAGWLSEHTDRYLLATERYRDPLELARENRSLNEWGFPLVRTDRLRGIDGPLAAVVANLPYVLPDSEEVADSVSEREPAEALYVPEDPGSFYGDFIEDILGKLRPGGELWLEGAPPLFDRIENILENLPPQTKSFQEDTAGRRRYLRITCSAEGWGT